MLLCSDLQRKCINLQKQLNFTYAAARGPLLPISQSTPVLQRQYFTTTGQMRQAIMIRLSDGGSYRHAEGPQRSSND